MYVCMWARYRDRLTISVPSLAVLLSSVLVLLCGQTDRQTDKLNQRLKLQCRDHLLEQVRDGELPLKVCVLNPQLGKYPVLRTVTRCPDWVLGSWLLLELYCEWNEVAVTTDVEQNERSGDVTVVGVTMNRRDVVE